MKLSERTVAIAKTFTLAALLASALTTASAQAQTQPGQQQPDSVVAVVANAMSLPFVPPGQRPVFGTFWEVRSSLPCLTAPLPFPPLDTNAPVYAIGDPIVGGQFLVDETAGQVISPQVQSGRRALRSMSTASILQAQVDELQTLVAQVQAAQTNAQLGANEQMSRLTPEGGGTFGPMPNTPFTADDLGLTLITVTNATGFFIVHLPDAEATTGVYDLFMTTNLSPKVPGLNLTNWLWLLRTGPGETNLVVPDLWADQAYFMLGRTNDTDGDGLSDAIEHLVTHTDPNVPDANPFPAITSQPLSQTVDAGDSVTFSVQATGLLPLNYQWQFTDYSGTTNINDASGPSLTLNNVDGSAAGSYSVKVWNVLRSTVSSNAVLTIQYSGENAFVLTGPRQDLRLKGNSTYFVDGSAGPVELYGTTVIEGGAVVKYSTNAGAKLVVKGPIIAQTGPYNPAVLTAQDDDLVGWTLNASTGVPTNYYAEAALEIASAADSSLKYLRITYAQTAIHYTGAANHTVTDSVRHAQILHCGAAFLSDGTTNTTRALGLGNILLSDVGKAIAGSHLRGTAQHLTVDGCGTFATDASASALGFHVTNSIFSAVTSLGTGLGLDGANNGFHPDTAPQFGDAPVTDDQPAFAPTGGVDGQGNPFIHIVNGQGAYYLRDGSPFVSVASTNADPALKTDFAEMTTAVPPELMFDDINSSMTLGPTATRDPQAQSLGYHYPVVDYVINGLTVNSATLNIDQGTVLACQGYPFGWGIRLNPGGRLNINGVPTNRVVFAHLEAIQESPFWDLQPWGPMVTWRELYFLTGIPTPYPQAKVLYTDFPTLSGGANIHFGPISDYLSLSYSIIADLLVDGCHFHGGLFLYDDGGPQSRSLKLRNTIFDRCAVGIYDTGGFAAYFDQPEYSSAINAANNIFNQCPMLLFPVPGDGSGTNWPFTDNIFDTVHFYSDQYGLYNGPVGVNHHNAYIGMTTIPNGANRLTPPAPAATDPDVLSLTYETGSLGNFYLPATATNLLTRGSRSAAAAGEYHFTSLTNNQKEAAAQVSIGTHYLALVSGAVPDSNADGIPDFLADRNGDSVQQTDEIPWLTQNTNTFCIIEPAADSLISGITRIRANPGEFATQGVTRLVPLVDGQTLPNIVTIANPLTSSAEMEIDTSFLPNGEHTLALRAVLPSTNFVRFGQSIETEPITVVATNTTTRANWQNRAQLLVNIGLQCPASASNYTITIFSSSYPKASDPFGSAAIFQGTAADGALLFTNSPANLGLGTGDVNPFIYSFAELTAAPWGQTTVPTDYVVANPIIINDPPFPSTGWWAAAYEDASVDCGGGIDYPIFDSQDWKGDRWVHDDQLNNMGWLASGPFASAGATLAFPPQSPSGAQTWPLRSALCMQRMAGSTNPPPTQDDFAALIRDIKLLIDTLSVPDVRNFYGYGHGEKDNYFMWIHPYDGQNSSSQWKGHCFHRYRFTFLDGCDTYCYSLMSMFGAQPQEVPQQYIVEDNAGFADVTWYYSTGLRPAAFIGNIARPNNCYISNRPPGYFGRTVEAYANWHVQLLAYWRMPGMYWGLYDAKKEADRLAWKTASGPPNSGNPAPPPQGDREYDDGKGHTIDWQPTTCLKIGGYLYLRFNDYNHDSDWSNQ